MPSGKDFKEEFLRTSFEYLVENGLENTSVRDLCKIAKISPGSVYYWFDGKDELYISIAEYGLTKIIDTLFAFAFDNIQNFKAFLYMFIEEVKKAQPELRLIYQLATSPRYGEQVRAHAEAVNQGYQQYISVLSNMLQKPEADIAPIVYMFMAVVMDYVVWDDKPVLELQLDYLYKLLIQ